MLALLAVIGRLFDIAARRPRLPRGVSVGVGSWGMASLNQNYLIFLLE
jgi:hypothetical protein